MTQHLSASRIGPVEWSTAGDPTPPTERRWPIVMLFGFFGLGCTMMMASSASMADSSASLNAENLSVGIKTFIAGIVMTGGAIIAGVSWALSVKYEIKSLRRQVRDQGKEIDILRGVVGQDASETD